MRLLNDELAKNILEASKKEFLEKGVQKASVRSIAAAVNVTTGAVYRYYENKEALFDALVKAPAEELYELYRSYNEDFSDQELNEQMSELSDGIEDNTDGILGFIYEHYDAFKLIACRSEGTKYADYVERLIGIETRSSIKLIRLMQADGKINPDFDEQFVHIISSTMFSGVFKIISHNEPIETVLEHIHILKEFYTAGWYKLILSISLDTFSTPKSKQVCNQLSKMEQISTGHSEMDICFILGIA